MKNIHVLPSDKSSSLFKDDFGRYFISINIDQEQNHFKPQNIYITSEEEIKEGDWCLNEDDFDKHLLFKADSLFFDTGLEAKKIILTTDQDLIKDGVQAIGDEFLEWFVKNSSFEEVLVEKLFKDDFGFWVSYLDLLQNEPLREVESKYNIIFPKKEVEQNCEFCKQPIGKYGCACAKQKEEAKQETLEQVAEKYTKDFGCIINYDIYYSFIAGAKWQKEQMYSEEEVDRILRNFRTDFLPLGQINDLTLNNWFNKFKKK